MLQGDVEAVPELKARNGSAIAKEANPPFLHLLRLSADRLEINRGKQNGERKLQDKNHQVCSPMPSFMVLFLSCLCCFRMLGCLLYQFFG